MVLAKAITEKNSFFRIRFNPKVECIQHFDEEVASSYVEESFLRKHRDFLQEGSIHISMKQHKDRKNDDYLITCQIRVSSVQGVMYATDAGYGYLVALKHALNTLEHQLQKSKNE